MISHLAAARSPNPLFPPNWVEVIVGAICFSLVFCVLWKVLLPRITATLEERTKQIDGGIERAAQAEAEAARLQDLYRAQLAEARHEASRVRERAKEEGSAFIAELREQAQMEARRTTEAAQAQIAADRQHTFTPLRAEIGTLAVELASKIIGEPLADEAGKSRVVDRFLAELDASESVSRW
jgi:F-type H+-transporting ATPase subunit b